MKKGEHAGRRCGGDRGLFDFARIIDGYNTSIVVRTSSAACSPCVWLFVAKAHEVPIFGRDGGPSAHLGVREAKLLRDALDRFIEGATA